MALQFYENQRQSGLRLSTNSRTTGLRVTPNPNIRLATIGLQGPAGAAGADGAPGGAPTNAEYIVSSSNATLSAERVLTNTATVTWDFSVAGQAKANGASGVTPAALTKIDDTNVTLTLGGTPTTALLQATSLTLGWTGTLAASRGGTGLSSLGTGIATWLGTPSSANLAAALTDETGSGAAVFATSPTLVTPALGTPASGILTNCTGLAGHVDDSVTYAKVQNISAQFRVLGRNSASAGDTEEVTFSQFLDWVGSAANGDILYRTGGAWARLAIGSATNVLTVASSLPSWAAAPGGSTAATQAEQEAASSTTVFTSPGRQQFHPSAAKAWGGVTYAGGIDAPALEQSYNVTSITDGGTTDTAFNFTTSFSATDYSVLGTSTSVSTIAAVSNSARATGSVTFTHATDATGFRLWFAAFGDQ